LERWSRRRFLRSSAGFPLSALALAADEELIPFSDYPPEFRTDAQSENPRVKAFDLRKLTALTTPTEDFFTFHQTKTVEVNAAAWRLRIGGLVQRPLELSLDDLRGRAGWRELPVTIECSGNSGDPRVMNGLVSTAVWSGVGLADVLKECAVQPEAREAVFLGMDMEEDKKWEAGNASYVSPHGWSLYVQDALAPDNLLAFAMNGAPLPAEHGFPLRLVMPGWYGMSQIKWLTRIELIDRPYEGRHMARNYQSLRAVKSPEGTVWLDSSISRNNLKSVVARVTRRVVDKRFEYKIAGAAWGGPGRIAAIEVQVDGGAWVRASIDQRAGDAAWVLWSAPWRDPAAGEHVLVSRAINTRGDIQPTRDEMREKLVSNREDNSQWARRIIIDSRYP
jgi:DMSO/TMAO reductase YedYZ molybdopterin-dependent catalytic subunit